MDVTTFKLQFNRKLDFHHRNRLTKHWHLWHVGCHCNRWYEV